MWPFRADLVGPDLGPAAALFLRPCSNRVTSLTLVGSGAFPIDAGGVLRMCIEARASTSSDSWLPETTSGSPSMPAAGADSEPERP